MAQILPLPRAVAISSSGVPYPGAKLYTYTTGTTTPLAVYSDYALTTPLSNPVIADSAGMFAALFASESVRYRFVLKTSADVTIYTQDDVQVGTNTATSASSVPWSGITSKPTTLSGYGISDAITGAAVASTYAPLASPTFTGVPAVPTASTGTNTTQVASTAFVKAVVNSTSSLGVSGYSSLPSGLVIQWGFISTTGSATAVTQSFPVSFSTACVNVTLTPYGTNAAGITGATANGYAVTTYDVSSFQWVLANGANLQGMFYQAVGY
jgi:hypothetical protein